MGKEKKENLKIIFVLRREPVRGLGTSGSHLRIKGRKFINQSKLKWTRFQIKIFMAKKENLN